jgi:SAM-dependent methyltransferase
MFSRGAAIVTPHSKPRPCALCHSRAGFIHQATLPAGTVESCNNCGTQSITPLPSNESLAEAYQNFDAGTLVRQEFVAYTAQAKSILRTDFEAAGLIMSGQARFLDYGCGGGHFVEAATELGVDAYGIDVDEESRRFGRQRGLRIEFGDYKDLAKFGTKPFTAILVMHVLEHVSEPGALLRALASHLEPGGVIIVRVPDQHSVPALIKRTLHAFGIKTDEWGFVQPPIHLHGYSPLAFEKAADALGLGVVRLCKTSPLDANEFPTTSRYWRGLGIHRVVYGIGRAAGSGGHIAAILRRPLQEM